MRLPSFTIVVFLALGALVTLGGCRSAPEIDTGLFGPTVPVDSPLALEDAWAFLLDLRPGETRERVFEIVSGEHAGRQRVLKATHVESRGAKRVLLSVGLVGDESPSSVERLTMNSDGDLVSVRSMNRDRDVITDFEPALTVFPARLDPKTPAVRTNRFIVHPFDKPKRVRQRGDGTLQISLVGRERVELPDRPVEALRVRMEYEIDFGARVLRVTDQWFMEGSGLVGERYEETIRVLGIETERRTGTMRAVSAPHDARITSQPQ